MLRDFAVTSAQHPKSTPSSFLLLILVMTHAVLAGLGDHAVPFAVDVVALFNDPHEHVRVAAQPAIQGMGNG